MVEGFFSKTTRQMFRCIRVKSKEELTNWIYKYFEEINEESLECGQMHLDNREDIK